MGSHEKLILKLTDLYIPYPDGCSNVLVNRALPDITFGSEVRQISKIRTVRTPDILLSGPQTFNTLKKKINPKFFFQDFFLFIYLVWELWTPNLCPGTLCYEN